MLLLMSFHLTEGFENLSKPEKLKTITAIYNKIGSGVDRKKFGFISLGFKEVNLSFNYMNTSAEYAVFLTLPKVLKKGIIIHIEENHKNRGYKTVTIAAPVIINGKRGNVAVVVKQTKGYRYKTHRILMPNGSLYSLENNKTEATTSGSTNNGVGPDITSVTNKIPQEDGKVKKYLAAIKRAKLYEFEGSEHKKKAIEFYSQFQEGTANKDNFFYDTIADFKPVKNRPKRSPDHVSRDREGKISSEYWYTNESVIRGSTHWSEGVATCDWYLNGAAEGSMIHTNKLYGKAKWGGLHTQGQ